MKIRAYPGDISDEEWKILSALLPSAKAGGRPRSRDMREVINAIWYVLRSGCQWRLLPHEFPPWSTVWHYFRIWRKSGVWKQIHTTLRECLRRQLGRETIPSAVIIDSQSVKTSQKGVCGYDGGKKVNGRKRQIVTDTLGLLLRVKVHAVNQQDRLSMPLVLEGFKELFPRVTHA